MQQPPQERFSAMTEGTAEHWRLIAQRDAEFSQGLPDRLLAQLRLLRDDCHGFAIDRLEHCLQSASRAYRDSRDEEYVVCALLHDAGSALAPENHAEFVAMILKPYISEKNLWMLLHHAIFQGYHFFHFFGQDRKARERFRHHPYYSYTVEFCERYDQNCFDPHYRSLPLETFEPMLRRVLAAPRTEGGTPASASDVGRSALAAADAVLLEQSLERLRQTGFIEYSGEFGCEITTFIPFVCWLKHEGLLAGRRVTSYAGMRPYYYFLDPGEFQEKPGARQWLPPEERGWPSASTYTATRERWHRMPDYRNHYRDHGPRFKRPVLFIQNKFTVEWQRGPLNYLPLDQLEELLANSAGRFDVVYSRPRRLRGETGYVEDQNDHCNYPDLPLVRRHGVLVLEDLCERDGLDYNQAKLGILAQSRFFVAVQGGGAHLLACFGDSLMLLLHREGEEYPHAYRQGPYKYLSNPPPMLMLARNHVDFARGIEVFKGLRQENGGFRLGAAELATLDTMRI